MEELTLANALKFGFTDDVEINELKSTVLSIFEGKSDPVMPEEDGEIMCAILASFLPKVDWTIIFDSHEDPTSLNIFLSESTFHILASQLGFEDDYPTNLGVSEQKFFSALINPLFTFDESLFIEVSRKIGLNSHYLNGLRAKWNTMDEKQKTDVFFELLRPIIIFHMKVYRDCLLFCSMDNFPTSYKKDTYYLLGKGIGNLDRNQIRTVFGSSGVVRSIDRISLFFLKAYHSLKLRWEWRKKLQGEYSDFFQIIVESLTILELRKKYKAPIYGEDDINTLIRDIDECRSNTRILGSFLAAAITHGIKAKEIEISLGQTTALLKLAKEYVDNHRHSYDEIISLWGKDNDDEKETYLYFIGIELLFWYLGANQFGNSIKYLLFFLYAIAYDPQFKGKLVRELFIKELSNKEELKLKEFVNGIEYSKIRDTFRRLYNDSCRELGRTDFFLKGEIYDEYTKAKGVTANEDYFDQAVFAIHKYIDIKEPKTDDEWKSFFNGLDNVLAGLIERKLIAEGTSPEDFRFRFTGRGKDKKSVKKIKWVGSQSSFCYFIQRMCTFEGYNMPSQCLVFFEGLGSLDSGHLKNSADSYSEKKKKEIDDMISKSFEQYREMTNSNKLKP